MNDGKRPFRIGRIDYANVWPVFHYFDPGRLSGGIEMVYGMPAELNRLLREGEIDLAAVSSFAYGLSAEDYWLLPDLSVSTFGRVQSLLLFLKKPLEQVLNGKIALTATSATTVNLTKIIMEKFYGGHPSYETAEPSLERMMEKADAALLIGDHAIRASWTDHGYQVLDLGELWRELTGHWMTYAVWAVRRDAAAAHPEAVSEIYREMVRAKRLAAARPEPLVAEAVRRIGGDSAYWQGYFNGLCHDFGSPQQEGLRLYYRYARELGLMDNAVALAEWSESVSA
ncbi:MAG: ABC transporter substrate-binding protein [Cohnella sp.]|uniref:menaquinone biosynthesis protein n=1 Tax=Cohnella sp. TaxID=1883426 RepID=UPI000E3785CA|nr:menaquinone biosynthesis protein [Cohnella sp.]REK66133.1 MAG: ABC transporter substrate-binding protein [Cohnella sp.]